MKTEKSFRRRLKELAHVLEGDLKVLGEFKNEFGENYIFYKINKRIMFAGDETDWEAMNLDEDTLDGFKVFKFDKEEKEEIKKILKENNL